MSQGSICDGCATTEGVTQQHGIVRVLDYCVPCSELVASYVKQRDDLHAEIVKKWDVGLSKIRDKFALKHPNMSLPDD